MFRMHRNVGTSANKYHSRSVLYIWSSVYAALSTMEFLQAQQSIASRKNNFKIDESDVLIQLSDLLPITTVKCIATNPPHNAKTKFRAVDEILSPEDKLRGVFLQKLHGKVAIRRALDGVAVELDVNVLGKVVNRGNLCGESMIAFFHWAIEQPEVLNDVRTYNVILKALGRRKCFIHMIEMMNEMKVKGVIPNSQSFHIVMDNYIRARQVSKAIDVFEKFEDYGLECNEALNVSLQCLCARSHVKLAWSLLIKMRERITCNIGVYNTIIGGWSRLGRVTEVEKCLTSMLDYGIEPDCVTYSYLLEVLGRAGRVQDAVRIFDYLGSNRSTVVYNAMIFNFLACGDINEALKYHQQMLRNNCEPQMNTYVRIILYFLKIRRVADAIQMFDEMLDHGLIPSTGTVTEFLKLLCSYGPPHAALMIYKKAKKGGCRISFTAYKLLLMRLARFGKCGMLLNVWNEMQDDGYISDMMVYEYIMNGLCNSGRLETAVTVFEDSLSKGLFPGKIIRSKLSWKLMESNKTDMAYKLFLKLKSTHAEENARRFWRAKGWHF